MNLIDWSIIVVYLLAMILMSLWLSRRQHSEADYYVGGRNLPWWAIGLSTMATQSSAISFISIPAFVALKQGGGLVWLQYELALPLAMILVMAWLVPFFRQLELVSVYQYLELRFDKRVRLLISAVFLLSRGLGTGVALYASALVLSVVMDLPLWLTILLTGIVTIIYDTLGGMKAVVYSDVIQMGLLLLGVLCCIGAALSLMDGNLWSALEQLPEQRKQTLNWSTGIGDDSATPFWAFLLGGLFLYTAYYGTDQSQVQRGLSAPSLHETRQALLLNGLARFPLTLLYVLMGLSLALAYQHLPDLQDTVAAQQPDYLVPHFIVRYLPTGIRAIIVAAILAAAMSSLDSALNSLSAITVCDFIESRHTLSSRHALYLGKVTTIAWGGLITGFAFAVGNIADTVIEAINKIGSAFYGPVLATFLAGLLTYRASANGALAGIMTGVCVNLFLWLLQPEIYWMWWNLTGFAAAFITTFLMSRYSQPAEPEQLQKYTLKGTRFLEHDPGQYKLYRILLVYFVLILSIMLVLQNVLT